ncbi:glycosyltransferase [Paucihalobacter ruber]|uniref:Glycosyltransferase n=1 Tax=Paucihalobacter ruber TaxID=2567861 RepID=A0A506PGS0_9FLAO|nr:glycosyltransferase [Paucihalobacter ruber]TPV32292.1 glycosyltransferase [Paucihalobacter ruber]
MSFKEISFIIPVYNRPDEIHELLQSFLKLEGNFLFEVLIIEDGSTVPAKAIVEKYIDLLNITYFFKPNTGPGDSRNYGMKRAKGDYFIILDSDCLLPSNYLNAIDSYLKMNNVDFFGGPDAAHPSFSPLQKAINFAMTSFLTTGGVRGKEAQSKKFQPRSFNMGLSKKAFEASGGFGNIHPGEDPDLSIRLWDLGFKSAFIKDAFVYHKRRISWIKFYQQVHKFGLVRPILNFRYPQYSSLTYWFPSFFIFGLLLAIILFFLGINFALLCFAFYFLLLFVLASVKEKSLFIGMMAVYAVFIQFLGYGTGFIFSYVNIHILKKDAIQIFPQLFYKN